jgi:hypothetical protein
MELVRRLSRLSEYVLDYGDYYAKQQKSFRQIPITDFYDFSKLNNVGDRPILVDITGDYGESVSTILNKHPQLNPRKFVL